MAAWLQMARPNRYSAAGVDSGIEMRVQAVDCPGLARYCHDDAFGTLAVMQRGTNRPGNRGPQWQEITSEVPGTKAENVSWEKPPQLRVGN